ncbi:class I SAM-dependent methyltransferase [Rhodanobacter sp. Root179]|uniref:class I SAM-dependent methyltransferase n=1 Tax=Rhodanobacter sp. Root179 TaxID=1736482 RepID=UPI0009E9B52F|nr:class I SAM-dependent methyltransferase [Rhodanobacter sp. Root179]
MNDARRQWENRAAKGISSLSGVLFQGLSEQANSALHDWHAWIVREIFLPKLPMGARILDLGCGYGRLSRVIARERPDIQLIGQDLAMPYCQEFSASCGPCAVASATKPPFDANTFDGIISITCLMYVGRAEVTRTLEALRGTLKPEGVFLAVDPGYELQRLIARLRGRRSHSTTGGQGFTRDQYLESFERSSFVVTETGGNPFLSLALVVPGVAASNASWVGSALSKQGEKDQRAGGYSRFALHRWIMARVSRT